MAAGEAHASALPRVQRLAMLVLYELLPQQPHVLSHLPDGLAADLLGLLGSRYDWLSEAAAMLLLRLLQHSGRHHDTLTRPAYVSYLVERLEAMWDVYRASLTLPSLTRASSHIFRPTVLSASSSGWFGSAAPASGPYLTPLHAHSRAGRHVAEGHGHETAQQAMHALEVMEERRAQTSSSTEERLPGPSSIGMGGPGPAQLPTAGGSGGSAGGHEADGGSTAAAAGSRPGRAAPGRAPSTGSLNGDSSRRLATPEALGAMRAMVEALQELAVDTDAARAMATLPCFELYVGMLGCRPDGLLLAALGLLHRLSARQNTHETFWDCDTATVLVQLLRSDSREGAKLRAAQVLERLCADPDLHSRLLTTDVVPVSMALLRRAAEAPDGDGRGGSLVVCLLTALRSLLASTDAKTQARERMASSIFMSLASGDTRDRAVADLAKQCQERLRLEPTTPGRTLR